MPRRKTRPVSQGPDGGDVRDRILDAALQALREGGIRRLTQPAVAARAGVRQSHLTYYFPTRNALLEACAMRFVDSLAADAGHAVGVWAAAPNGPQLAHLTQAVTESGHMRMFMGVVVEADRDPSVRAILLRGIERLEAALAPAFGGGRHAAVQAAAVLATLWGLGLYAFVVRPSGSSDPTRTALAWLRRAWRGRKVSRPAGR